MVRRRPDDAVRLLDGLRVGINTKGTGKDGTRRRSGQAQAVAHGDALQAAPRAGVGTGAEVCPTTSVDDVAPRRAPARLAA